jgi:hypothetical protein
MSGIRDAFRITAEREREISARIAEAISRQRDLAGNADGANAAMEIARLIREDGLPEIREAFLREQRQRSESILSNGWFGQSPSSADQETIRVLREIDPNWSGKKPIIREPIEVRTLRGLSAVQLVLKRRRSK